MNELLQKADPEVADAVAHEAQRQQDGLEMIASENYTSPAVMAAQGSVLTNKYAEGLPGKRYYGGCEFVDVVERLAIDRLLKLFGADRANVQPHSGAQANMAVYFACLKPGDTILAMDLAHGGHLTHGMKLNFSGKLYKVVSYGVRASRRAHRLSTRSPSLAREHKPKLVVAGASAYPREIDFAALRADLQGGRRAVHGGHGPHRRPGRRRPARQPGAVRRLRHLDDAQDAARPARRLHPVPSRNGRRRSTRRSSPACRAGRSCTSSPPRRSASARRCGRISRRTPPRRSPTPRRWPTNWQRLGFRIVSGGTDNHLLLVDVASRGVTGKIAEEALDRAGITVNKNKIPFDQRPPLDPSGIRIGTPALTTRGMRETEMRQVAAWIGTALAAPNDAAVAERVRGEVRELCRQFPAPA